MASFINSAKNSVSNIRDFMQMSKGSSTIKYQPVGGEVHHIYVTTMTMEQVDEATGTVVPVQTLNAIAGQVHEWKDSKGFKATVCAKGRQFIDDNGVVVNDGSCPICDRISDAWAIVNYRQELEESTLKLIGEEREAHLKDYKKELMDQLKAKKPTPYMYVLIAKFKMQDKQGRTPILDTNGLPEFELKVMKLSQSRLEKIQTQLQMQMVEFAGAEIGFSYPQIDGPDAAKFIVGQSTIVPYTYGALNYITTYPKLKEKIDEAVAKFVWDDLGKAFPEWQGMSTIQAKNEMDASFEKWDAYKAEKAVNPSAKYLEYVSETPASLPEINIGGAATVPGANTGIVMPNIPTNAGMPGAVDMTGANVNVQTPDPAAMFSGMGTPTI